MSLERENERIFSTFVFSLQKKIACSFHNSMSTLFIKSIYYRMGSIGIYCENLYYFSFIRVLDVSLINPRNNNGLYIPQTKNGTMKFMSFLCTYTPIGLAMSNIVKRFVDGEVRGKMIKWVFSSEYMRRDLALDGEKQKKKLLWVET